jgi:hypothetical protein
VIYVHGEPWWNDINSKNSWFIHQTYPTSSHLVAGRTNGWRKLWIWYCKVFLFILPKRFLHAIKFYMGPLTLLPLRMKVCCRLLSLLKSITSAQTEPVNLVSNGKHWSPQWTTKIYYTNTKKLVIPSRTYIHHEIHTLYSLAIITTHADMSEENCGFNTTCSLQAQP